MTELEDAAGGVARTEPGAGGGERGALVAQLRTDAFAAIPDSVAPVAILASWRAWEPATASAVLAALRPDLYPFFDEVVARQIPDSLGPVAFTCRIICATRPACRRGRRRWRRPAPARLDGATAVSQALWAAGVVGLGP